jgi:transposase
MSILARNRGIPFSTISQFLHISRKSVYRYLKCYQADGFNASFTRQSSRLLKANDEENINAVFSLLHYPPSDFGINRTSWIIKDLKNCLEESEVCLSKQVISEIIKKAGYRWKKAKVVLTSNDPQYKQKLEHIKGILSSLSKDERFFSCDEFGPFAVKMKTGRRLVAPGEYPNVPQFQKSKGSLILTGALELSTNQVTHFYSKKKNTDEMIRLLDVLLKGYKGCTRIYLSWDAASWHISKKLNTRVDEVNAPSYRRKHKAAEVVIAPLPASAQFLNVIESVFSGMARAIIHNSNYGSVDEAKSAIDRYYKERNKHFQDHPKVAGRKIWGSERVPSQFDEARNCKDVKFR